MKSIQLGRKKAAVGIGAVLLLAASLVTVSATLSAQTTECSADQVVNVGGERFGTADYGNHLLSITTPEGSPQLAPRDINLPAGTYSVDAVSTDGYVGRDTVTQVRERWVADFIGEGGVVLATTEETGDVADQVETGYWSGSVGTVTLSAPATSVIFRHAYPGPDVSPNSVRPVCLGITDVTPQPAAVDPCDGAVAGDGAVDGDGNACVDPCDGAVAGDGAVDGDGNACVDPCVEALQAVGVSAEAAEEACAADTAEDCVDIAVTNENNAAEAAPAACGVETGTEGTGDTCVDTLVAEGADIDGATAACASDSPEACVAAATAAGAAQAAAEEACAGITVQVQGATVTADPVDTAGDDDADDDDEPAVAGATITAPVAQAQTGNPTFTG